MKPNPAYRSPIRLLDELGVDVRELIPEKLKLERKRLLLEIQLSDGQILTVGDRTFTKNDVLQNFDAFESYSPKEMEFHRVIYASPELLNLLEKEEVERKIGNLNSLNKEIGDRKEQFTQFLSPYIKRVIRKLLNEAIKTHNFLTLERVDSVYPFLTHDDALSAFQPFEQFCLTLDERLSRIVRMRNEIAGTSVFPKSETQFLHYRPFYNFANHVAQYYPSILNVIALAVLRFVDTTKGSLGEGDSQHKILTQLRILRCSKELEQITLKKTEEFPSRHQLDGGSGFSVKGVIQIVLFVILGMVFISRSCGDDERSRNDDFLQQLEEIRRQRGMTDSRKTPFSKDFNEEYFKKLQKGFIVRVENNSFETNDVQAPNPSIASRWSQPASGEDVRFTNQTESEMFMVVWSGPNLNSYYIEPGNTVTVKAKKNARLFFYAGVDWQTGRGLLSLVDGLTFIQTNGHFSSTSKSELELLRKRFMIDDVREKMFTISQKDSVFDLYQGDRLVNFSY